MDNFAEKCHLKLKLTKSRIFVSFCPPKVHPRFFEQEKGLFSKILLLKSILKGIYFLTASMI